MPINIDQFQDKPEDVLGIKEGTQPHTILNFLAANDEQAFTQAEIHEATDVPRGSVSVVLSRLENRGLVRHRGRYWAITDDQERLQSAYRLHRQHETADDQYGEECLETLQTEDMESDPSSKLETATANRENWQNTTPTDAGEALFGTIDPE